MCRYVVWLVLGEGGSFVIKIYFFIFLQFLRIYPQISSLNFAQLSPTYKKLNSMGCCNSAPAAPDVVMPDPMEGEACTFSLKKAGMMSR